MAICANILLDAPAHSHGEQSDAANAKARPSCQHPLVRPLMMNAEKNWGAILIFLGAALAYLAFEFGRLCWIRHKRRKQNSSFRRMKSVGQIARDRAEHPPRDHR